MVGLLLHACKFVFNLRYVLLLFLIIYMYLYIHNLVSNYISPRSAGVNIILKPLYINILCTVHQYNKKVTLQLRTGNNYKKENARFQGVTAET